VNGIVDYYGSESLATVDANPTIDSTQGGDGGAMDLSSAINAAGMWGTAIASIVTGRPAVASQGAAPGQTIIGVAPPAKQASANSQLLLVVVIVGALAVMVVMSK
jgi:hypothetical protein